MEAVHELEAKRDEERDEQQEERQISRGLDAGFRHVDVEAVSDEQEAGRQDSEEDYRGQRVEPFVKRGTRRACGCPHRPPEGNVSHIQRLTVKSCDTIVTPLVEG